MPTTTPLTDAIQALTTYANEVTGASDTTLSEAVATLAAGYGGGGTSDDYTDFTGGNIQAIISHGTEYILTDLNLNMEGVFCCKLADSTINNYEGYWSMGYGSSNVVGMQRNSSNANTLNIKLGATNGNYGITVPLADGSINVVTLPTIGLVDKTTNKPLVIFGNYYNGNLEATKATYTFYGLNIVDADMKYVVRIMPWLDSNNVPCVKDLISGTLYHNSGSGSFDYIDANGNTVTG